MDDASRFGLGVSGWFGLLSLVESQYGHMLISLAKSVGISEKLHHVGGFGDPPKARWKHANASKRQVVIVWTTTRALWAIWRHASLQSHLAMKIVLSGHASLNATIKWMMRGSAQPQTISGHCSMSIQLLIVIWDSFLLLVVE
jgi:hypothetical protein